MRLSLRPETGWPEHGTDPRPLPPSLPGGAPWPRISVVTPSLNQGEYIEDAIRSVLHQRYPDVEHIVIDGASTDQTPRVLSRYEDRLARVVSEPDRGQSEAINKGFRRATGDVLMWLNADDMLAPGALAAVAMAFHTSRADVVAGICHILRDGQVTHGHLTSCPEGELPLSELLDLDECWLKGRFFHQPEVAFSWQIWERAGGYVDEDLYWSMDYDLWVRFARARARLHVIGRPVAVFRVHEKQKTFAAEDYVPELRKVSQRYGRERDAAGGKAAGGKAARPDARPFKAAFVNDCGSRHGAGIAHRRLADAMEMAGHPVSFVQTGYEGFAFELKDVFWDLVKERPDVVFVGNLHGAGDGLEPLELLTRLWPTCQVLHDLWAVTGRCAYSGECTKYQGQCDETCPTPDDYPPLPADEIHGAWQAKRDLLAGKQRTLLLANSDWTRRTAESSAIVGAAGGVRTIKLAPPLDVFRPRDRSWCREQLGLPEDHFIILFAACDVLDTRKGASHLVQALDRLSLPNVTAVSFGLVVDPHALPRGSVSLGYLDDPETAAMAYSASDVFVGPSLEEAFGQVFVEAAACGTPSVAYPVGGVPEALTDGVSGRLARAVDPAALAEAIEELYGDADLRESLGRWGRIHVENEWSMASAYHRLSSVLDDHAGTLGVSPPRSIELDCREDRRSGNSVVRARELTERYEKSRDLDTNATLFQGDDDCWVRLGDGFGPPEGPFPRMGLSQVYYWAIGAASSLILNVAKPGRFRVRVRCANFIEGQEVRVLGDGVLHDTIQLRTCQGYSDTLSLEFGADLRAGLHEWTLQFKKTVRERGGTRELGLIVFDVDAKREDTSPRRSGRRAAAPGSVGG